MNKVTIIGGGFAGIACARELRSCSSADVTVLDRKPTHDFLPLLPDIVGGRIVPSTARVPISFLADRYRFRFVEDEVRRLDLAAHRIVCERGEHGYDYLVIAAGTRTDFHGDATSAGSALTLDDVSDAERLCAIVDEGRFENAVVVGGGYTGIEIATNLRRRLRGRRPAPGIVVVETAGRILGALPEWMSEYAERNLARMGVEILVNCRATAAGPGRVVLSNGRRYEPALLIWAAGVQTPAFVRALGEGMTRQGRREVDPFLRLDDRVFVVGDTSAVVHAGQPLRMAVQFALAEGSLAGRNIVRHLNGEPLRRYRPVDLGYVVPMANLRSCGLVLGGRVRGLPASLLHYIMCVYRAPGFLQGLRVIRSLVR